MDMPTSAPDTLDLRDFGAVEVREAELQGYSATFLHLKERMDMTPMLRGLPGDICPCPHWGIVTDGAMTVRYADHEERVTSGSVFYMPPGHVPVYDEGTRLIFFSPSDEMRKVNDVIEANAQALRPA